MKVERVFKDPLSRQAGEAVMIRRTDGNILNSMIFNRNGEKMVCEITPRGMRLRKVITPKQQKQGREDKLETTNTTSQEADSAEESPSTQKPHKREREQVTPLRSKINLVTRQIKQPR